MDAAVTEPTSPTIRYTGKSIEERVSTIEGTITNQNRIFDMLHEGQQNLRTDIVGLRAEMRDNMDKQFGGMRDDMDKQFGGMRDDMDKRFGGMRDDMDKRFGDVDKRFGDVDKQFGGMRDDMDKRFGDVDKRFGEMRDNMDKQFGGMRDDIYKWFGAADARIAAIDVRLNTKIDSNLKMDAWRPDRDVGNDHRCSATLKASTFFRKLSTYA